MDLTDDNLIERFRRVARNNKVPSSSFQHSSAALEIRDLQVGLNKVVYTSSESWMLPAWATKQASISKSGSISEDALSNNMSQNWITIGGVGSSNYAIMDETGLVTANRECGSIDFWFEDKGSMVFPALVDRNESRIELYSPDDQLFEWRKFFGAIEVIRQIYHGTSSGREALYNEIHLKNHSLNDTEFVFYAVLRPTSVRGVEPLESVEYDSAQKMMISNGYVAMLFDKLASSIVLSTADNPNLIATIQEENDRKDTEFSSVKGLVTAVLKYRVNLAPAESKKYFFVSPLSRMTKTDEIPFKMNTNVRDEYVGMWFDFAEKTTNLTFPEVVLNDAALQAKAVLAQQVDTKLNSGISSVGSTESIEWARVFSALCRSGCSELAKELALKAIRKWFSDEKETPPNSQSSLIWGILQYFFYFRDMTFLKTISPLIGAYYSKMQLTIEARIRVQSESGDLADESVKSGSIHGKIREDSEPKEEFLGVDEILAVTAELREDITTDVAPVPIRMQFGLRDIVDSLWDLAALRIGVVSLEALEMTQLAESLCSLQNDYAKWLESKSVRVYQSVVDQADDPDLSLASLDLLAAIALLGKGTIDSSLEQWSLNTTLDNLMRRNLVMIPGEEKRFSSHLALRLAHYYVFTLRKSGTWNILRRAIELLSEYHTLPEFVDPHSGAGHSGDGCSMIAAADLLILLREMVVSEMESDIVVLPAIPDEWYTSPTPLLVDRIPLSLGEVDIEVGASTNQHQIEIRMTQLPNELEIHVPTYFSLPMMKVFGGGIVNRVKEVGIAYIRALPMSNTVIATFHR
ncbi:MAG: hypothetical protein EAX81_00750 [Candidatus Thorarchaeota archaeon]|nr:hypothetical protein [Candidatus Thorarchaeota archaeon]